MTGTRVKIKTMDRDAEPLGPRGLSGGRPAGRPGTTVDEVAFRAGLAAVAGRPNVGKSALVNAWVGSHLSIVSPKPQTTRQRVFGICTRPRGQVVFVDTPGLVEPRNRLHESMILEAEAGIEEADVILHVCAAEEPDTHPDAAAAERLRARGAPALLVVNKIDRVPKPSREGLRAALAPLGLEVWLVSATAGDNLEPLLDRVMERLPASPPLFPEEDLATQSERFFVEEYVRETALELYGEEVPHSVVCRVEEFREDGDPVYIRMSVFVERASQKGIVVGRGGEAIRRLGVRSRRKIEALLGRPVYLDLWVKVLPGWRRSPGRLRDLGFRGTTPKG